METMVMKYKLKRGSEDIVKEWQKFSKEHEAAIKERLQEEGISIETAFLDKIGDDTYLYYFLKARNLDYAYKVFEASNHHVDIYQKQFKEKAILEKTELQVVLDLEAPSILRV